MYNKRSGLILGFHGCNASLARQTVLLNQTLKKSHNGYDWLGHGIYFWEHNLKRAWTFAAKKCKKNTSMARPGVIGAVIDLGNCLDLLDKNCCQLLQSFHKLLLTIKQDLPQNSLIDKNNIFLKRELDCTVLELFHLWNESCGFPAFDSVRQAFEEGPVLYKDSAFREETHIQICIRNPKCIKAYFLPIKDYALTDTENEYAKEHF
ncbi:hypothetical protein SAMN05444266_104507 [Chitinophaga jiangningensis]|uniref:DUF3990 domain-containing protein n=1 Tax=Chitinophaga jiangningensis TaxID=1419482 RepID=A0A1M7CX06_9BACT|nr:hypothetical protein [Chitinophaga jiangningensis]SHL71653.1 hypothetical protein SAMN05444266_104507 [Chitinophaga jiangningensis]